MKLIIPFLLLISVQFSCNAQSKSDSKSSNETLSFIDIDNQTALKMMSSSKDLLVLDVRTPEEIAKGKIGSALEIDYKGVDFKSKLAQLDKNKPIIIYCAVGGRSGATMKIMKEMGFNAVYNLAGGYNGWEKN